MLITFRYLYVNKKESGHDVLVLKGDSALKVTVKDIARPSKPVACFTYIEQNPHKIMVSLFKTYWFPMSFKSEYQ